MEDTLFESLIHACEQDEVDWLRVRGLVASLGPSINDRYEEASVLSEVYKGFDVYRQGWKLLEITRLFLDCGYDVSANDGMNGGECLKSLCWSSYDAYTLETAELLLDAGADPNYTYMDGSDKESILEDISWKMGCWHTGDYLTANMFEAYYRMIELAQHGEDYHGIRAGDICIGKRINKIEKVSAQDSNSNRGNNCEEYILWCDGLPLKISKTVEIFIDPSIERCAISREDLSEAFHDLIGRRIVDFLYMNPTSAQLVLDNGHSLAMIGDELEDRAFVHLLDVDPLRTVFPDKTVQITGIYFPSGRKYSDSCRDFDEEAVLIKTESGNILLYSEGEDYKEHQLKVLEIGQIHSERMNRRLAARDIRFVESIHTGASLSGLHFLCDGKHFYLMVTEFHGIKLFLGEAPVDPSGIGYYSECMKITFGDPGEAGFGNLSQEEDRRELFDMEKKRLAAMLQHGAIT